MTSPKLIVVAGPNGSGKSTLIHQLISQGLVLGKYINADDIAKEFNLVGDEGTKQAQRIADEERASCLRQRRDFAFETVMSHVSKPDFMGAARQLGYHVTLFFVCTADPLINVTRVEYRVAHGGHDVPHDKVIERYRRTLELVPIAITHADRSVLFDNSVTAMDSRRSSVSSGRHLRFCAEVSNTHEGLVLTALEYPVPDWVARTLSNLGISSTET